MGNPIYEYHFQDVLKSRERLVEIHTGKLSQSEINLLIATVIPMLLARIPLGDCLDLISAKTFDKSVREISFDGGIKKDLMKIHADLLNAYCHNMRAVLNQGHSLLFFGPNSSGKTFTAFYLIAKVLEADKTACYVNSSKLYTFYNASLYSPDPPEGRLGRAVMDVDYLVIDEVGKETGKDESLLPAVEAILKYRSDNMKPTVLVTNLSLLPDRSSVHGGSSEFHGRFGDSVVELLKKRYRLFQFSQKEGDFRNKTALAWSL